MRQVATLLLLRELLLATRRCRRPHSFTTLRTFQQTTPQTVQCPCRLRLAPLALRKSPSRPLPLASRCRRFGSRLDSRLGSRLTAGHRLRIPIIHPFLLLWPIRLHALHSPQTLLSQSAQHKTTHCNHV
ncbi:unnamed protein product [Closterium sp. Naga37s-1]|nr:unnamed protein product [Closterium sp. Naga37s-1]